MTQTPQDIAYSPSRFARDHEATLARQAEAGRAFAERHPPVSIEAGQGRKFNLFIPEGEGPWPLMVFIHGGYWQALDHTATDFLAERYLARGMAFASLEYGLAPGTSIEMMIEQCQQGVAATCHVLAEHGGEWTIHLGGHSAGAQLAYWVAATGKVPIDKLLLVSGVFDLTPLVDTYVNQPLGLSSAQAQALSPRFGRLDQLPPCQVVVAENDPPTFREQSHDFVVALRDAQVQARFLDVPGCDHFDVLDYL
ncbi:alpha/beta hydrolase [Halomonas aquamarina]|uniref:Alpha/beta hydrolase n=1 Tax=Vreelandella aquamarina TaxID=77097 RepID=A0ACC5VSB3_9GAMM|nr:alpha/beta hydrolase [Halomonas aquamarina]MBZ5486794.1 alpha/beta hydrolase [Halomonas aquamarina]